MRARVDTVFECEAVLLTELISGRKLNTDECGERTQGHLTVCIGSVVEDGIAGIIPGSEVKVVQPLSVGLDPDSGWAMHHEQGSVLVLCPLHAPLVARRKTQLEAAQFAAQEKVNGDGDGKPSGGGEASGEG